MMSAMMALYDSELKDEIFTLMELANIKNYTQFSNLNGSTSNGKKEGSVAWPGSNEILLLIMDEDKKIEFKSMVEEYKREREKPPGLLLFDWALSGVV